MRQPRTYNSANDNAPRRQSLNRPSFRRSNPTPVPAHINRQRLIRKTENPFKSYNRKIALTWAIPILAVLGGVYAVLQAVPLSALFWPSLTFSLLLFWIAKKSEPNSRLRNFSGLIHVAALTTSLAALLTQNGFTLIAVELTLLVSTLALVVGWVFKSIPAVLLSAFSALVYLASFYPDLGLMTGLSDQLSQLGSGLVPWIILGQIILAQKFKSSPVLFTAIVAAYIWLGTIASNMPLSALAGLGLALGAAHYWLGKAWADSGTYGADIHRFSAGVVASGAAFYFQSIWLNADIVKAVPFWPPSTLWWTILGVAMFTLFIASLKRYKTSDISLMGIFIVSLAVVALPLAAVKPDLVHSSFDAIPGLDARPGLGLIIGAIIVAVGFIWLVSGLRRGRLPEMCLGAVTIGIEALVLLQPSRFDTDLGVIFIVSLICALCIGGLIAGTSPERTVSHRNFA